MSCTTCRHSRPVILDLDADEPTPGMECWRYPPIMLLDEDGLVSVRPQVAEGDTCGEWSRA